MLIRAIAMVAMVLAGGPLTVQAADLSGAWLVKGEIAPKLKYTLLCVFTSDKDDLAGPCVATQGHVSRSAGEISGDKLHFGFDTSYNGSGLHLDFKGVVQPNGRVTGKVSHRLGDGQFQGSLLTAATDTQRVYTFDVAFTDARYALVCAFKAVGAHLAGPCAVTDGAVLETSGASEGAKLAFNYDTTFNAKPVHVAYAGVINAAGAATGEIKADDAVGTFQAARP